MHEWALAESIVDTAVDTAKRERLRTIDEIIILIGELQQIERDIFEFALKEITKTRKTIGFKKTIFNIKIEKSRLKCRVCGYTWSFNEIRKNLSEEESEAIHFIPEIAFVHTRCPRCNSPDFEIISGRGIAIKSIRGSR
ncbi:MAG: hydrogenase nickel insertion protein HypA [Thermoplasmata archaeon]|nr:MAG: hydrogenase nickel insertion protein HypA [Thermoplasmata archaeon]